jgi:ribosomal protein S18
MPEKSNNRVADEVTEAINRKSIKAENLMMSGLDLIEKFITDLTKIKPKDIGKLKGVDNDFKK